MYSLSDAVERYIELWCINADSLNQNPVKFILKKDLGSELKLFTQTQLESLVDTLDDLTVNAMQAASGIYRQPDEILKLWKPEDPSEIIYITKDVDGFSYLEIIDKGHGINPRNLMRYSADAGLIDMNPEGIIEEIFKKGVSTKESQGKGLFFY